MSKHNFASYSTPEELASSFNTDLKNGLQQSECDLRLNLYGFNDFNVKESPAKVVIKFLEQFKNPLLQLLVLSVVISVFMGQYDDAISISLALLIVITVAFIQEYRSEKSLKALNKLVPPTAKVIRNGTYQELLAKFLVPGDLVLITTGDRVPADLRLIECQDLGIDESNMTGETELSVKNHATRRPAFRYNASSSGLGDKNNNDGNNNNSSTSNNGNVTINLHYDNNYQTKNNNRLTIKQDEKLADHSSSYSIENMAYMGTLVQSGHGKGLVIGTGESTQFGTVFKLMQSEESPKSPLQQNMDQLGNYLSVYSLAVVFVIVIVGWLQSRPIVEMFTIGVSLAVAAIPEGLPIVVTVTLALGVMRMAKKNAVVKQLSAVETLGCVRIICSDKTGTLTKNEMTVTEAETVEGFGAHFTGVGYDDKGEVILRDLSRRQEEQMSSLRRLFTAACLCNNAQFDFDLKLIGQATEGAILVGAKKLGLPDPRPEFSRLEEIPFSSKYKYMAVKCAPVRPMSDNEPTSYFVKGALPVIMDKCKYLRTDNSTELLDRDEIEKITRSSEFYENQALRVIGVASGPSMQELTFLGMIAIHDAPRPGVDETIRILSEAGVEVKMVTGDSRITAESIAKLVGIGSANLSSMSGAEVEYLHEDNSLSMLQKAERISKVSVFYRVNPSHKVIIVKMMQLLGNITAMTGDGVNDSVALKKADIGIAMGMTGTDVCKEAAAVILMDDNLRTLIGALEEGKGIFYNIRNFIKFQLSTSIAALSLIATTTFLHIPTPFNAMQILYINILMDGPPAQSLGVETVSQDVLMQPPRNVKEPVLTRKLLVDVIISASVIFTGTLLVFISELSDGWAVTPRDTTMTFTCFVLFDLFNAMSCRSQTKLIFEIGFFTNKAFLCSILGSLAGQILVIYCPPFQAIFQTEALSLLDIVNLVIISSSVFFVSEGLKLFKNRVFKRRLLYRTSMYII